MKGFVKRVWVSAVTAALTLMFPFSAFAADVSQADPTEIVLTVTINGLDKADQALITVSQQSSSEDVLASNAVAGDGNSVFANLKIPFKEGYYELVLNAPDKYFRDPKGYDFAVSSAGILNPAGNSFVFNLIPPAERGYQPYRDPLVPSGRAPEATDKIAVDPSGLPYRIESFILLSAPSKAGEPGEKGGSLPLSLDYHYFGPYTSRDNLGLQSMFAVADTGVTHDGSENQFVVIRDYCNRVDWGTQKWIETGWCDGSSVQDTRFAYEYDSQYRQWHRISWLQDGTNISVRVRWSSGTTWVSEILNDGGSWVQTYQADIQASQAQTGYNRGEAMTQNGIHPYVPTVYCYDAYINLSGAWTKWTDSIGAGSSADAPYDYHMIINYYDFYMHTH